MKYCNKCRVNVAGSREKCPLCQNELNSLDNNFVDQFPDIRLKNSKINFIFKIFILFSIILTLVCGLINYQISGNGAWFKFVAFGVITFWVLLFVALKKRKNVLKCLLYETVIITCFLVGWDYYTGMHGWSIEWALPIFFSSILITMGILSKVLKIGAEEHIVYLLSSAMFGIIPGIFFLNNMLYIKLPSMICIGISCILFVALVLFEGRKMWLEFSRRFHV